jgi:hypothetical protein
VLLVLHFELNAPPVRLLITPTAAVIVAATIGWDHQVCHTPQHRHCPRALPVNTASLWALEGSFRYVIDWPMSVQACLGPILSFA